MNATAPQDPDPALARGLLRWLWRRYLGRHKALLSVALIFMTIEGSMFGFLSWLMKPMFDRVFTGGDKTAIWWVATAFFAIFAIRAVASVAQKWALALMSQRTVAAIRQDLVDHFLRLDLDFHAAHPPGLLMQRVEGDVEQVNAVWTSVITGAGRDVVALVSLFTVALLIDWQWTLIALVGAPILVIPSILVQRWVRKHARTARENAARLSVRLSEILNGIVPIKLNRLEGYESRRYRELTQERIALAVKTSVGGAAVPGLLDLMAGLGFMGVLLYGGSQIVGGARTVGDFMAFFTALGLAFEPLRRLGSVSGIWQVAAAAIERIRGLFEFEPSIREPEQPVPPPSGVPDIRYENVSLRYGSAQVLEEVTFTAEAGKRTALIGASGAGKSTVFNALTRLVDPVSGNILIGGISNRAMSLADLRDMISVVSQEPLLFDETLRENILLGRADISEDRLMQVLQAAHVTDFLDRLPKGLDTPVGTRGSNLSGGQRQRVAIARALLRDTPILLLDEATSALDARSERVVQAALDRLSEGRTTLVIAHRLSTIRTADRIVVMDQGHVVDIGTHTELLARGGLYADLHRLQVEDTGPDRDAAQDP